MTSVENKSSSATPKKSPRPVRKQKRISKLSKEQLELALRKKRECNSKALKIVEELIEHHIDHNSFIEKLQNINQSHYDDIVEERSITKICGYPLCEEVLTDIPSKQFHISTTTNKVYDITERKKFCSNSCFKSSNYLKEQLLTSPLWLRDQETLPDIKLLPHKRQERDDGQDKDILITKLTSMTLKDDGGDEDLKS
ncbi:putative RNA polymerase II subunit B1 CTD phosphatase RPAP2 homolog [Bradysia coprophila]|uniref:putative RNA polymerase II subunit B1 CTD phosphatase RPAP2 homolog n=1 Tax=Bradysia coprophila TaxID=38358 RepID=UPI00187DA7AC|nr:putative RNA polymerase II subunit B1 CTD phosphatase RPAP2 homolog [Bradysia coprophila]